jgi:hypothetical protein
MEKEEEMEKLDEELQKEEKEIGKYKKKHCCCCFEGKHRCLHLNDSYFISSIHPLSRWL